MSDLLKINVNQHTERKNGLTYLSWAWAWAEVLKVDPLANWVCKTFGQPGAEVPYMAIGNSSMVQVSVTIKGITRECMLPVMDHRNKAIQNPDAFQVNTAVMRCLTKAIGMHGLGLYIYAGEDLPEADLSQNKTAEIQPDVAQIAREKREKSNEEKIRLQELDQIGMYMLDCHKDGDDMKAIDLWYREDTFKDNEERLYVWGFLKEASKLRAAIKANKPEGK